MQRSSVDSLLRTSQAYCQQVCDKQTLEYGIAFYSERFPRVAEANQFREVWIDDPARIPEAFDEAEAWFAERELRCRRWAPAGGQASDEVMTYLADRGFALRTYRTMMLTQWVDMPFDGEVRILPARAMRAAFRTTLEHMPGLVSPQEREQAVLAMEERLDDPPYDMFVALQQNKPVGCCALYQVGDVARVMDLTVADGAVGDQIADGLLAHVLGLARRLAIKHVYTQVPVENAERHVLFARVGFVADGELIEFERGAE